MYEYICSNKECNYVWTIREGNIGTLYLTCPTCNKGIGKYLRQTKDESDLKKIMKKQELKEKVIQPEIGQLNIVGGVEKYGQKDNKPEIPSIDINPIKNVEVLNEQIEINQVTKNSKAIEDNEENIFDRIIKKRQQEQEFVKDIDDNVDILEVMGDSLSEIEKRIKEFEEFYYIKVIDKNIVKHGNKYNCIIKYNRK